MGRAGWGLHLPVLARIREFKTEREWFSPEPCVVFDPRGMPTGRPPVPVVEARSLEHARSLLDPDDTVVHLCTPPSARTEVLERLSELGFRTILVEKPLASDRESTERILAIRKRWKLNLMVVGHWLDSAVTRQLAGIIRQKELGGLRSISVIQHKPRFSRSLMTDGHPSAFDVEIPHSLGVVLHLAGDAKVVGASWTDMVIDDLVIPRMGGARLRIHHESGVETEIFSLLTSMQRERRITLSFDEGEAVGYYPVSQDDEYGQVRIARKDGSDKRTIFPDDSLTAFLRNAYRRFSGGDDLEPDFMLNVRVTALLSDAKQLCAANGRARPAGPKEAIGRA